VNQTQEKHDGYKHPQQRKAPGGISRFYGSVKSSTVREKKCGGSALVTRRKAPNRTQAKRQNESE